VSGLEDTHSPELPTSNPTDVRGGLNFEAIDRLTVAFNEQASVIQEQAAYIARYKKMYDRASASAKIGVWECDLATETVIWTDGVYDIFELPRGSEVSRAQVLDLYDESSRLQMNALREKAIREAGSFQLDIRIRTATGKSRWVRLTADIECEDGRPVRIFGLKQDITQEKDAADRMRLLAETDPLTGLANRGLFQSQLGDRLQDTQHPEALAALVVVDLDGFKQVNDTFGHAAGDECLRAVASRFRQACDSADVVARLGGDEFAILLSGARDRDQIEAHIAHVLAAVQPPILWQEQTFAVGASFGIAIPRIDAAPCPATLFTEADSALYAAKKGGGNTFRTFEPAVAPEARPQHQNAIAMNAMSAFA
jgi:diguanylate cyclase (GGDEF)-like protein